MEGAALVSPVPVVSRRVLRTFPPFRTTMVFDISLADIGHRKQILSLDHKVKEACCTSQPGVRHVVVSNMPFIYPGRLPVMLFRDQTRRLWRKSKYRN